MKDAANAGTESPPSHVPGGAAPGAVLFVGVIWLLMLAAALAFVWNYGSNVPYLDDWAVVPQMTGARPVTIDWLLLPNREHRPPVLRLVMVALFRLTGDLRVLMVVQVAALACLAFAMMHVARRVRGWTSYADAFFPLALLHLGYYEVFLISFHVAHVITAVLVGLLLLILVKWGTRLTGRTAALAAGCLVIAPWVTVVSVPYVIASSLWLGLAGASAWGRAGSRRTAVWAIALAAVGLAQLALLYHFHEDSTDVVVQVYGDAEPTGLLPVLRTVLQFAAMSLGHAAATFWPFAGSAVLALALVVAGTLLAAAWRGTSQERVGCVGLLLFLGAAAVLALGAGLRRTDSVFASYYAIAAVLGLPCLYLAAIRYCPPALGQLIPMCLFILLAATVSLNAWEALEYGTRRRAKALDFERDLRAGVPLYQLVRRHSEALCPSIIPPGQAFHAVLVLGLRGLRQSGTGDYSSLVENPAFREVRLPVVPAHLHDMTWKGRTGQSASGDAHALFPLPRSLHVAGIRVRYEHLDSELPLPLFEVGWRKDGQKEFGEADKYHDFREEERYLSGMSIDEKALTFWIDATIDCLLVRPDNRPCRFRISEIVLLVAADAG